MRKSSILIISSALIVLAVLACSAQASASQEPLSISWTLLDDFMRPGDETTLIIYIQNTTAQKIYDIDLSFVTSSGLTVTPSELSFNSISALTSQSTSLKVTAAENASSGTSYLEIDARYHVGDVNSDENVLKIWIPVVVRAVPLLQIEDLRYTPATVEPGSEVIVSFNIKNYGDGPAKDLVVSLDQMAGFFNTDLSEKYIGDVPVNGSSTISFNVTINQGLSVGSYSIPIQLVYKDEKKESVLSSVEYAGIKVYGDINLITTLDSQDTVAAGTSGTMEIKIANAGTMDVQFLQLTILDSQYLEEIVPSSVYVGSLKSDDYDTERISFKVGSDVPKGVYPVSFELVYKDPFGKEFTETKTVDLSVLSKEELGNNVGIPVWQIVLLILVAALVVYYFMRKRRK